MNDLQRAVGLELQRVLEAGGYRAGALIVTTAPLPGPELDTRVLSAVGMRELDLETAVDLVHLIKAAADHRGRPRGADGPRAAPRDALRPRRGRVRSTGRRAAGLVQRGAAMNDPAPPDAARRAASYEAARVWIGDVELTRRRVRLRRWSYAARALVLIAQAIERAEASQ